MKKKELVVILAVSFGYETAVAFQQKGNFPMKNAAILTLNVEINISFDNFVLFSLTLNVQINITSKTWYGTFHFNASILS